METNNITDARYTVEDVDYDYGKVSLSDPDLVRLDRIRFLTDRDFPFYDLSYAWGTLKDGTHVEVDLGVYQISKRVGLRRGLVEAAQAAGRYAKGLHMLEHSVISLLS